MKKVSNKVWVEIPCRYPPVSVELII